MSLQTKLQSSVQAALSEPQQWLEKAIEENHVKYFDFSYFKNFEVLSMTEFGKVEKAIYDFAADDTAYILKSLKDTYIGQKALTELVKEINLHRMVDFYKSILKFYGVTKDNNNTYILVLQWANGGSLRNHLRLNFANMTEDTKLGFAKQIAKGLMCLHQTGIIHRDLNSTNVLVHNGEIKISDFGLSKVMEQFAYIDPQCFKDETFVRNEQSDIYALGVLLWELSSGRIPFEHLENNLIIYGILKGHRETPVDRTHPEYAKLYTECWNDNLEKRPPIEKVVKTLNKITWITESAETSNTQTMQIDSSVSDVSLSETSHIPTTQIDLSVSDLSLSLAEVDSNPSSPVMPNNTTEMEFLKRIESDVKNKLTQNLRDQEENRFIRQILDTNDQQGNPAYWLLQQPQYASKFPLLIGLCYLIKAGNIEINLVQAFHYCQLSAQQNDLDGQLICGQCYYNGWGVSVDYEKAVYWFQKVADIGNGFGQNNLGWCYEKGLGVSVDGEKAAYWYRKAAEAGNADGQNSLGGCYQVGFGVDLNNQEAFGWFKKAARAGNAAGQSNLGWCYENGLGVDVNYKKAFYWYKKSADAGDSSGQYNLGWWYRNSWNAHANVDKAKYWFKKAADQGHEEAGKALKQLNHDYS